MFGYGDGNHCFWQYRPPGRMTALAKRQDNVLRPKPARWTCKIQNREDERVMHVTVQVFNLHFAK